MKVSGFTFIRNAIIYDFPIMEAISSVLPIVDEFVVNVGKSKDGTLDLIYSIDSPKIRVVESVWDDALRENGKIFGIQQDLALSHCTGDWALLVQGDEVLHEQDYPVILQAMEKYFFQPEILGLVFRMVHFKGDYWSVDPWMYRKATRIVRNHCGVHSTVDCCDFLSPRQGQMIKSGPHGKLIDARMFHYGWVKDPKILKDKLNYQISRHEGSRMTSGEIDLQAAIRSEYPTYDTLKDFKGTHPELMKSRIDSSSPLRHRRNRWLNPRFYKEIWNHGFKG